MPANRNTIPTIWVMILSLTLFLSSCIEEPETLKDHRAGLIIQHGDGHLIMKCIHFQEAEISGEELLRLSQIPFVSDVTNPMGSKICAIDGQGCNFPSEDCFCQCSNIGPCTYWAYFALNQEGEWVYSPLGAKARTIHDGDVDAWAWLTRASKDDPTINPTLPKVDIETICGQTGANQ